MISKDFESIDSGMRTVKLGDMHLVCPKESAWDVFINGLSSFSDDFMESGRSQGIAEERSFFI